MDMSLSKFREIEKDREAWHDTFYGVAKSWTWLSDWITTINVLEGARAFQDSLESFLWCVPLLSGASILGFSPWISSGCTIRVAAVSDDSGWAWSFHPKFPQGSSSDGGVGVLVKVAVVADGCNNIYSLIWWTASLVHTQQGVKSQMEVSDWQLPLCREIVLE